MRGPCTPEEASEEQDQPGPIFKLREGGWNPKSRDPSIHPSIPSMYVHIQYVCVHTHNVYFLPFWTQSFIMSLVKVTARLSATTFTSFPSDNNMAAMAMAPGGPSVSSGGLQNKDPAAANQDEFDMCSNVCKNVSVPVRVVRGEARCYNNGGGVRECQT